MLVRQRAGDGLDVYLTRRSSRSRFMPDAYVFPGGRVDDADRSPAARERLLGDVSGIAPEFAIAALRELFEEAGVLIAADRRGAPAVPSDEDLREMRAALNAGALLTDLLERRDLVLDARRLAYYSNWVTPEFEPIRFDTHFFIARAPRGQTAEADAVEVHDGRWFAPTEALERAKNGEMNVQFPTRAHLERIAAHDTVESLFGHARSRRIVPVVPIRDSPGEMPRFVPGTENW